MVDNGGTRETALSAEDQSILAEELALHERVKIAVREEALAKAPDMSGIKSRLVELRDEAISASERDLPALFQQLYTHHSLAARTFEKKLPDMRAPYFAHMRLVENGKARDILIGYQTFIDTKSGITIIDWRNAVLAKVFFNFKQGDDFELELPGRIAHGVVAMRRVVTFDIGELVGVSSVDFSLMKVRAGEWQRQGGSNVPDLEGGAGTAVNVHQFGVGAASRRLPDVSALLDQEQYEILNREDSGALLILGGAGSGKTTVALHRMASLAYKRPRFYNQKAMKVVVPEQGLVRLTQRLLGGLNLDDVGVDTFDGWVTEQGRQILKGLPKRLYHWTPPEVVVIKRHPAMFVVVDQFVAEMLAAMHERARFLLGNWRPALVDIFSANHKAPIWSRVERFEKEALAAVGASTDWYRDKVHELIKEFKKKPLDVDLARSELYTSPDLLKTLVDSSGGVITPRMAAELSRHTRKQFEEPDGGADQDDRRAARSIDDQEVEEDDYAGTLDVEDYAVLLYLMLRIHGRVARKTMSLSMYKHLVVDEAQDLAPIELRLLGKSLANDSTVTIAGDAAQQSDPTVVFRGWDDVLFQLDVPAVEEARLNTNYRSPRPVAEFGHMVLGSLAPPSLPDSIKDGRPVIRSTFPNEGLAVVHITEALNQLFDRERLASVAVICENDENARSIYEGLKNVGDVRLVLDGEFQFKPGVDVTDVSQIKGLEFDYVIIPDANANVYPDTAVARRTMHIAVTRAVHQLWVISVGRPSELLASN